MSPGLLLAFYGDDFTGSTDAMEVLALAGLRTVLFLEPPGPADLARFPGLRAVGVAGSTRCLAPDAMEAVLTPAFRCLRDLGPPLLHYKVCSTFDSSPRIGSIGRALETGLAEIQPSFVPIVVGAPALGRYCVFGNLFARSGLNSEVFRLDRHPTMRSHPTTPMDESDVCVLLARQTPTRVALLDAVTLSGPGCTADASLERLLHSGAQAVLFDTLTEEHLATTGRLLWSRCDGTRPLFAVGSSGVEYALVAGWRQAGLLSPATPPRAVPAARLAVVSGSCSPVTERQIRYALGQGFAAVPLHSERLVDPGECAAECAAAVSRAAQLLEHRSVILHTALGPADPRVAATRQRLVQIGCPAEDMAGRTAELLGTALGTILHGILKRTGLRRAATTGGDSSSFIARALGVRALEVAAPCAPGSPLCTIHANDPHLATCEITFKGGQVGTDDYFCRVLAGTGMPGGWAEPSAERNVQ